MADPYLAIAEIADDPNMNARMNAAATQQEHLQDPFVPPEGPLAWVSANRWIWAASPSWGEKWRYAETLHATDTPPYEPGKDEAVITDADILSAVQSLMGAPARAQAAAEAPEAAREDSTTDQVAEENAAAGST